MKIYLIRHGQTDWNAQKRVQGLADRPLNELGLRQAEALADGLEDVKFDAIYSSPLQRAVRTAEPLAKRRGLEIGLEPGLMELDQGEMDGLEFGDIQKKFPDYLAKWIVDPAITRMPGGETLEELQNRAWEVLERLSKAHKGQTIAATAHNFTILTLLCKALAVDLRDFRRIVIDPASWQCLEFGRPRALEPDLVRVTAMNVTAHLNNLG